MRQYTKLIKGKSLYVKIMFYNYILVYCLSESNVFDYLKINMSLLGEIHAHIHIIYIKSTCQADL